MRSTSPVLKTFLMALSEGLVDCDVVAMGLCSRQQLKTLQMPVITEACTSPPEQKRPQLRSMAT